MQALPISKINSSSFRWPVRVYYEDTDAGGVVYHANYLKYFERARTERLRSLGFELNDLQNREGVLFVVRSIQVEYLKPAYFNDALWVTAEIEQIKAASLNFKQFILRDPDDILCEALVRVVCLWADAFRPAAIPNHLLHSLKHDA